MLFSPEIDDKIVRMNCCVLLYQPNLNLWQIYRWSSIDLQQFWKFIVSASEHYHMSHITRKRVFRDFRRGKIQTSLLSYRNSLESWNFGYSIILSQQQTIKVLIRLRGCADWSAPLLFAYGIRHVFAWPVPYNTCFAAFSHLWFQGVRGMWW